MTFRMGVNLGDMSPADDTIHGNGVNIASRLEKLTEPGGVCIGRNAYDQMRGKLGYGFIDLGEQRVHNIAEPVHAYRVKLSKSVDEAAPTLRTRMPFCRPTSHRSRCCRSLRRYCRPTLFGRAPLTGRCSALLEMPKRSNMWPQH